MDQKTFLRICRAEKSQTQKEAAADIGVSRHTFGRWESGEHTATLKDVGSLARWSGRTIEAVALAFGVSA